MACDNYRIDMIAAAFGQCKCGAPKSEHVMTSAGARRTPGVPAQKPIPDVVRPPSPPDKALRAMEQEYTVDMDRDASEAALKGKSSGAFLLRPKDDNGCVVSVNVGGMVVTHTVIFRVAGVYQSEGVGEGQPFRALSEILNALRLKLKLSSLTFYEVASDSSAEPTLLLPVVKAPPPALKSPPVSPVVVAPAAEPPQALAPFPGAPAAESTGDGDDGDGNRPRGTVDDLDDLNDFLKDSPGESLEEPNAATEPQPTPLEHSSSWRRSKAGSAGGDGGGSSADLFDDDDGGGGLGEGGIFTEGAADDLTATMQLSELQGENRRLRKQVNELLARVRARDEALGVAHEKLARVTELLPAGQQGACAAELATSSRPANSSSSSSSGELSGARDAAESTKGAKDLLLSKLGEFGFSAFSVENVLDDSIEDVTVNEVLDRLLTQGDNLGAGGAALGLDQGVMAQSSFLGRQAGGSGRRGNVPPASQFGLFGDDGVSDSQAAGSSGGPSTPAAGGSSSGGSSDSSSTLFGSMGAVSAEQEGKEASALRARQSARDQEGGAAVSYNAFLARLMRPESGDLVQHVKLFLSSVLGPNGDGTPPQKQQQQALEYQFYGTHMLARRCADFFEAMVKTLAAHAAWVDLGELGLASSRNHFEKYVMTKLSDLAIAGERDEEQDWQLAKRMVLLDFVSPEALEVNPNLRNEMVWSIAQDELRKMAQFKAPGDKIACVVKCCQVIFSVLNLKRGGDDTSRPGADDFLPIFIFVVLKSHVPNLFTNCEYIQNYHNPAALMSKAGYCFVNLRSAVEFILTLDASVLNMDDQEFNGKLAEAEAKWDEEHPEERS